MIKVYVVTYDCGRTPNEIDEWDGDMHKDYTENLWVRYEDFIKYKNRYKFWKKK